MLRKKFAKANFNFIKRQFIVWIATSSKTNLISICYVRTNQSLGFSWEKLPPQWVMRGHQERYVSTLFVNHIKQIAIGVGSDHNEPTPKLIY